MELWMILLIVAVVVVAVAVGLAAMRRKQRSGSVLAAPSDIVDGGNGS